MRLRSFSQLILASSLGFGLVACGGGSGGGNNDSPQNDSLVITLPTEPENDSDLPDSETDSGEVDETSPNDDQQTNDPIVDSDPGESDDAPQEPGDENNNPSEEQTPAPINPDPKPPVTSNTPPHFDGPFVFERTDAEPTLIDIGIIDDDPDTLQVSWTVIDGPLVGDGALLDAEVVSIAADGCATMRFPANGEWSLAVKATDAEGLSAEVTVLVTVDAPNPFTFEGAISDVVNSVESISEGVGTRLIWDHTGDINLATSTSDQEGCFTYCDLIGDPTAFRIEILP